MILRDIPCNVPKLIPKSRWARVRSKVDGRMSVLGCGAPHLAAE
jgi:hypothetical protein